MSDSRMSRRRDWIEVISALALLAFALAFMVVWPEGIGPLHIFGVVAMVLVAARVLYKAFSRSRIE